MWYDPGHRAASLLSPCPPSPSQPRQLSLQFHPKITSPGWRLLPQHRYPPPPLQARDIPARGAASAASLGTTTLPFAAGMLAGGEKPGMQGMQAVRRRGTNNQQPH